MSVAICDKRQCFDRQMRIETKLFSFFCVSGSVLYGISRQATVWHNHCWLGSRSTVWMVIEVQFVDGLAQV